MEILPVIGILGSVASIFGAFISWKQAANSKKSASEAEKFKNHIIQHRKGSEITQIQDVCRKTLKAIEKFGPAAIPENLQGASVSREAKSVQDFLQILAEHRADFITDTLNEADKLCTSITPLLDSFAQASSTEGKMKYGRKIYYLITPFLSVLKNMLDQHRENI